MTLDEPDISGFTYPELEALKGKIELRMEELRERGVPALLERFAEEAAALGVTLEEVVGSTRKKPRRPRKPRSEEESAQPDAAT